MRASLVEVGDSRWAAILRQVTHDVYHLPAYVALAATQERGQARGLIVQYDGATMLLPLIIRPIPAGGLDAISPYGYPGPLATTSDHGFLQEAWAAGVEVLRSEGLVSLFVRFHPLLEPGPPDDIGTVIQHGDTVAIDLTSSSDLLWRQIRKSHRRDIEKAELAGFRARIDVAWDHFETFKHLYRGTMSRSAADAFYFFNDAYFDGLRVALGERLFLAVAEINGTVAAAGLYTETCELIEAHLSGVDPDFSRSAPTKLVDHAVVAWAKARGNRWLHLGGGRGGADDTLLQYKAGFSPLRFPYYSLRVALNPAEYARLTAGEDPSIDPSRLDGYFPAYRRG